MIPLYCSQGHENPVDNRFCRQCGEKLNPGAAAQPNGLVGQLLGLRYQVVRELGHGGFGRTYLVQDAHRFNEFCVLKEFAPQVQGTAALQKAEELFAREAGTLYKLQHPQIPRFRELFRAEFQGSGRLFLVQDYVEGQTYQALLQARRDQGANFTEAEVTELLGQLLPVLSYLHGCGVIHRDISPDNLIRRTTDGLPMLIDFGGVKQIAATVAYQMNPAIAPVHNGTRLGKIGYAPNEQLDSGEALPPSDLYALAMTVLVLLTGKEPQDLLGRDRRQWKREVRLSPRLVAVLDRMLDPIPARRYQSAAEVLKALGSSQPLPRPTSAAPLPSLSPDPAPTAATLAVSPAWAGGLKQSQSGSVVPAAPQQRSSGAGAMLVLLLLIVGTAGGWWVGTRWLAKPRPLPTQTARPDQPLTPRPSEPPLSEAEQARKQAIEQRRQALGIRSAFLVSLVDEAFYAQHPERAGKPLSRGADDTKLRAEWDSLAGKQLDRLQNLSAEARSRLGSYTAADLDQRRAIVNRLNLSSRALNDLTDVRFFALFPEQSREQDLLQKQVGQVWQAIASDELRAIQSGKVLEQIKFKPGNSSQELSDTLQPGEGKAYLARLSKDQVMQLQLQAPKQSLRLSIYPPTSKLPPLLADSTELEWSGSLPQSGLYEIVLVSTASDPVSYELAIAVSEAGEPAPPTAQP